MVDAATKARSKVVLWAVAVVTVGAVVAAVVVSVLRTTPEFDPATPEGVAQQFYQAVLDGDELGAFALMSEELSERCDALAFGIRPVADGARIVLESTQVEGDRAVVVVEIEEVPEPSPFDLDEFSHRQRLILEGGSGAWMITGLQWPYFCPEGSE